MFGELVSHMQVLKAEVPNVESERFALLGEALGFAFSPVSALPRWRWGLMQNCVPASPTCLDLVFFCHCCIVIAQPDFRCFIKGTSFKIFLKCCLETGYPIAEY